MNAINLIQRELLQWFWRHQRQLPWREEKDPYKIWVSEIMLQQTRVDTVIPYFGRFMAAFPTVKALAAAEDEEVVKLWEGLGYYSRVRNLHHSAKEVVAKYDGQIPCDLQAVLGLKGIGSYTAGAILSIAFDMRVPAVDGNVMRVLSRLFMIEQDIAEAATKKQMEQLATELIPPEAGDFNQALMELGAMICTPRTPQCEICPLQKMCQASAVGKQLELPVKKKTKPPREMQVMCLWLTGEDEVVIYKRPAKGLLAGMWALPTVELEDADCWMEAVRRLAEMEGFHFSSLKKCGELEHIFSHRHWKIQVIHGEVEENQSVPKEWQWIRREQLSAFAFPTVYRKVMACCLAIEQKKE